MSGYRIEEELAGVGANTAVGRTRDVTGTFVIEATSITDLSVEVDRTALASDERRDGSCGCAASRPTRSRRRASS